MAEPIRLTRGTLDSLLGELDQAAFVAFVADLYERMGWETERDGAFVTLTKAGEAKRLFVWTDDRPRLARLLGADPEVGDLGPVDAIVARQGSLSSARALAGETDTRVIDTADLHDRLLYGIDRDRCRALCRRHFDRAVDPRPVPETDGHDDLLAAVSRTGALIALGLCGLLVVIAAGTMGGPADTTPERTPTVGTPTPVATDPVTPVGFGTEASTPSPTPVVGPGIDPPLFAFETDRFLEISPGSSVTIRGVVSGRPNRSYTNVTVSLGVPSDDFNAVPLDDTPVGTVAANSSHNVSWSLETEMYAGNPYPLNVNIRYVDEGGRRRSFNETYTFLIVHP